MQLKSTQRLSLCLAVCLSWLVQCVAPVDAPSAFDGERFLCDEEHLAEFEALLDECRAARQANASSCSGVMSLKGVIDRQEVVLDGPLLRAIYIDTPLVGVTHRVMTLKARAPYFILTIDARFDLDPSTGVMTDPTHAPAPDLLNLEGRGANYLSSLDNPERRIEPPIPGEVRFRIAGNLSRGGYVDSCFHVFLGPN